MNSKKDRLFDDKQEVVKSFEFDQAVADVFDDMVSRSVPFYDEIHRIILDLVDNRFESKGRVYDLGCSTGTTIALISEHLAKRGVTAEFVGVDNSAAMIEKCREKLNHFAVEKVELRCEDLNQTEIADAELVIMNYTLQFIPQEQRKALLTRIHQAMRPGAIFLLSEKLKSNDEQIEELMTKLYYDFKRRNGYSELEISQKREALENVLVPMTPKDQINLLKEAGFVKTEMLFRWYNFASYLCIK